METPHENNSPLLCQAGCGFYGSPATENLCSVCYRKRVAARLAQSSAQAQPSTVINGGASSQPQAGPSSPTLPVAGSSTVSPSSPPECPATAGEQPNPPQTDEQVSIGSVSPLDEAEAGVVTLDTTTMTRQPSESSIMHEEVLSPPATVDIVQGISATDASDSADSATSAPLPSPMQQTDKSRCAVCARRLGLLGFTCRCGLTTCRAHLHSSEHNCAFDYRSLQAARLEKRNPRVAQDKISRI